MFAVPRIVERGTRLMYYNMSWRGFPTGLEFCAKTSSDVRPLSINADMNQVWNSILKPLFPQYTYTIYKYFTIA